jgi:hypothetical protein
MKYIEFLRTAIHETHGCDSTHVETVPVHETFQGQTAWQGNVEVFSIRGHPTANQCYAWGYTDGDKSEAVAVLAISPINSPLRAVQAYIASESKRKNADQKTKNWAAPKGNERSKT